MARISAPRLRVFSTVTRIIGCIAVTLPMIPATAGADIIIDQDNSSGQNQTIAGPGASHIQNVDLVDGADFAVRINSNNGNSSLFQVNAGRTVSSGSSAVLFESADFTLDTFTNNGTISSNFNAINVNNARATITNFTNTGTMQVGGNFAATFLGTVGNFTHSGTTENTGGGSTLFIHALTGSGINTASGIIRSNARSALVLGHTRDGTIRSFTNQGQITTNTTNAASAAVFVGSSVAATVTSFSNTNLISSTNTHGISLSGGGSSLGLNNSGTIIGGSNGINVSANTELTALNNSGTIRSTGATGAGILFAEDQNAALTNAGTIENTSTGAGIQFITEAQTTSDFTNTSIIRSTGGIAIDADVAVTGSAQGFVNSGTITGGGGVAIDAEDSFRLTNTGTISGAIDHATAGALTISQSSGSITGNITSTANAAHTLSLTGGSVTGNITLDGATANTVTFGGVAVTGNVDLGDGANHTATLSSGTITGNLDIGTGSLDFSGGTVTGTLTGSAGSAINMNQNFTTSGALSTLGSFNMGAGRTLTMGHNITAATVNNSGTVSIATGATRTITGDFNQLAGGVLRIGATSTANHGKLSVTGTATLPANARIDVDVANGNTIAVTDTLSGVIDAGTLTATTFNVTDNSRLFNFVANINGNAVDLVAEKGTTIEEIITKKGNKGSKGAGKALQQIVDGTGGGGGGGGDNDAVTNALGRLTTDSEVTEAVEQTLPLLTANQSGVLQSVSSNGNRIVQARLEGNLGLSSGDQITSDRYMWGKVYFADERQDDVDGVTGYDAVIGQVAFGADDVFADHWRLGLGVSFAHSDVEGNAVNPNEAEIRSAQMLGYASYSIDDATEVSFQVDGSYHYTEGTRPISFGGLNRVAQSEIHSFGIHGGVAISRLYPITDTFELVPLARADLGVMHVNDYTETGAGSLNLQVDDNNTRKLQTSLGGKAVWNVADTVTLYGSGEFSWDFLDRAPTVSASFVGGGGTFVTEGIEQEPLSVSAGIGGSIDLTDTLQMTASYAADYRKNYTRQSGVVKLRLPL